MLALRWSFAIGVLSAFLLLGGLTAVFIRVSELESEELLYQGRSSSLAELERGPEATRVSARLVAVELRAGEQAFFELCFQDGLPAARWRDALQLVVWKVEANALKPALQVALDQSRLDSAARGAGGACLQLGGFRVPASGRYALDAVWLDRRPSSEVMKVNLDARVIARTPLLPIDGYFVAAIALGTLIGLFAIFLLTLPRARPLPRDVDPVPGSRLTRGHVTAALLGIGSTTLVWAAVTWLPLLGSAMGLLKGLAILAAGLGAALLLAPFLGSGQDRLSSLALRAPRQRPWLWLPLAALIGAALVVVARAVLALVPATGEAPIQTFVSWPSGMLSFAALGMVVPVGEELFFRGFVYRASLVFGKRAAFAVTVLLFLAMHAPQSWGNWGSLTALFITSVALTGLRAASGSSLVPAFSHLLYNLIISMRSL